MHKRGDNRWRTFICCLFFCQLCCEMCKLCKKNSKREGHVVKYEHRKPAGTIENMRIREEEKC